MYGYRARIGYCSPPFVTEVFCSEFYKMAPQGVTLMITTLAVTSLTSASTKEQMAREPRQEPGSGQSDGARRRGCGRAWRKSHQSIARS